MEYRRRGVLAAVAAGASASLAGCTVLGRRASDGSITVEELTLTTTSSVYDTGLIDEVNAAFEERFGILVSAVSQGTGAALRTARDGDADAVLVHARPLEDEFLEDGYGVNRRTVLFNDFVLVGPAADPAGVADAEPADGGDEAVYDALEAVADAEAPFVSRGDESGTHRRERDLWDAAGVEPTGDWYVEVGQDMGETLTHASEQDAYALSDRGTYRSMRENLSLEVALEGPVEDGPPALANPYGVLAVNPAVHDGVNYDAAMAYIGFLTGREGQEIVGEYTVDGEALFVPSALSADPAFEQYVPEEWRPDGDGENPAEDADGD